LALQITDSILLIKCMLPRTAEKIRPLRLQRIFCSLAEKFT
jgi:hypothetical protein